jgi:hypothetical protein
MIGPTTKCSLFYLHAYCVWPFSDPNFCRWLIENIILDNILRLYKVFLIAPSNGIIYKIITDLLKVPSYDKIPLQKDEVRFFFQCESVTWNEVVLRSMECWVWRDRLMWWPENKEIIRKCSNNCYRNKHQR